MRCANCGMHCDETCCSDKCYAELEKYLLAEHEAEMQEERNKIIDEEEYRCSNCMSKGGTCDDHLDLPY